MELLKNRWKIGRFLSVGLDSDTDLLPSLQWNGEPAREAQFIFNRAIVDATYRWAVAYKPNYWFYASEGEDGFYALGKPIAYIHEHYPVIPVILDLKGVDIGNTSKKITKLAFDRLDADAVTVNPYLGREGALEPLLERSDKGIFILCRTSNPGAKEIQDLRRFTVQGGSSSRPNDLRYVTEELYLYVAKSVKEWNTNGNCGLVAGATHPQALEHIRTAAPDLPFLIPGIGAQGGELESAVRAARDENNQGFLINASRSVIFASKDADFSERAGKEVCRLHRKIRKVLKEEKTNEPEK
jgi:orotidine-5'-phosphate decarboxylase